MNNTGSIVTRRRFLVSALGLAAFCVAFPYDKTEAGKLALYGDKEQIKNSFFPVLPPGVGSRERFNRLCTGCQLCVSICPHQTLHTGNSGLNIFQPSLRFTNGYCHPECTACSQVCPTRAIRPIEARIKKRLQLGRAVLHPELCLVQTEGISCTECARHCPASAIVLTDFEHTRMPFVDNALCTGCGACEFYCPVRPAAAIQVAGNTVQTRL